MKAFPTKKKFCVRIGDSGVPQQPTLGLRSLLLCGNHPASAHVKVTGYMSREDLVSDVGVVFDLADKLNLPRNAGNFICYPIN